MDWYLEGDREADRPLPEPEDKSDHDWLSWVDDQIESEAA